MFYIYQKVENVNLTFQSQNMRLSLLAEKMTCEVNIVKNSVHIFPHIRFYQNTADL